MRVIWTPEASQDRMDIWDYLVAKNSQAAIDMDERFSEAAEILGTHPMSGHRGKISGTRELIPHEHYRLVYEIAADTVWVLALVHTSRLWQSDNGGCT
ncbi:type II toxin-antitoxin system RelE/ParE family toxin [Endozoicomonas sp. ALD040]|uniref:type II toxin-antitoxin system RelE/ParE family toxin n=1 Tax=unclassified Endozoicomonas TaxID=2644528 RepID=UPI003BAE9EFC